MFESDPNSAVPNPTPSTADPSPTPPPLGGPPWATGKDRETLIREMDELYSALPYLSPDQSQPAQPAQPAAAPSGYDYGAYAQPAATPQPAAAQPSAALPPDPSLAQTDPERWQREFDAYNRRIVSESIAASAGQYSRPLLAQQAQTARELSRRDPRSAPIWERYGHEIDREMAKAPLEQRTKSAYDMVVDMIRGRHFDELSSAQAAQRSATPTASANVEGEPQPPEPKPLDKFWSSDHFYARRLRDSGMTKTSLREKIREMNLTEKQWVDGVASGNVVITSDDKSQSIEPAAAAAGAE